MIQFEKIERDSVKYFHSIVSGYLILHTPFAWLVGPGYLIVSDRIKMLPRSHYHAESFTCLCSRV